MIRSHVLALAYGETLRRRARCFGCALILALGFATASPARAQSPQEINIARQTALEGLTAYKAGDFDKSLKLFEQARALYPSANILRMLGYSHLALGHWKEALETMEAAMSSSVSPLDADDRKDVDANLAKALAHFGSLTVKSGVADAEAVIDGDLVKLPMTKAARLLEGKHKITVRAPDHLDASQDVDIGGGRVQEIVLDPTAKEAPPPPPPPPPPPVVVKPVKKKTGLFPHQAAVGATAFVGGVVLGGFALGTALAGKHWRDLNSKDVDTHNTFYPNGCTGPNARLCQYDVSVINMEADRANHLRTTGLGLGIGAGVLGLAGAILFIAAPKTSPASDEAPPPSEGISSRSRRPTVSLACSPSLGSIACAGSF